MSQKIEMALNRLLREPPSSQSSLEDIHFAEAVDDFLVLFTDQELQAEPYLRDYAVEQLARWGRWMLRGRAPALCFEAACVGSSRLLEKRGLTPTERTSRIDAAVARALAGMLIDSVEPLAAQQAGAVRSKAVGIVADEFLAKATAPRLSDVKHCQSNLCIFLCSTIA